MSILFEAWRRARSGESRHAETLGAPPRADGRPSWVAWALAFVLAAVAAGLGVFLWRSTRAPAGKASAVVIAPAVRAAPSVATVTTRTAAAPAKKAEIAVRSVPATKPSAPATQQTLANYIATSARDASATAHVAVTPTTREAAPNPASSAPPDNVRAALPDVNVMVHVWNPDPARRFIVVDGRTIKVGDEVAPGVTLVAVTRDGEIVRFRGYRLSLPGP